MTWPNVVTHFTPIVLPLDRCKCTLGCQLHQIEELPESTVLSAETHVYLCAGVALVPDDPFLLNLCDVLIMVHPFP